MMHSSKIHRGTPENYDNSSDLCLSFQMQSPLQVTAVLLQIRFRSNSSKFSISPTTAPSSHSQRHLPSHVMRSELRQMSVSLGRHAHQAVKCRKLENVKSIRAGFELSMVPKSHNDMTVKFISHRGRYMSGLHFAHSTCAGHEPR